MQLPKLTSSGGAGREISAFLGLNRTELVQEGEFCATSGLSTERYPVLSQRRGRTVAAGYTNPSDIYSWDGHLVVIADHTVQGVTKRGVYYDGVWKGEVSAGRKQFAVVNTKLVIFPDKLMLVLANNAVTLEPMDKVAPAALTAKILTATDSSLTAGVSAGVAQNYFLGAFRIVDTPETVSGGGDSGGSGWGNSVEGSVENSEGGSSGDDSSGVTIGDAVGDNSGGISIGDVPVSSDQPASVYIYGTDPSAVAACWVSVGGFGGWNTQGLSVLRDTRNIRATPSHWHPVGEEEDEDLNLIQPGEIILPLVESGSYAFDTERTGVPANGGIYAVLRECGFDYQHIEGTDQGQDQDIYRFWYYADVYDAKTAKPLFSATFDVYDAIDIIGTPYGIADVESAIVTGIDDGMNQLIFAPGSLIAPDYYLPVRSAMAAYSDYLVKKTVVGDLLPTIITTLKQCLRPKHAIPAGRVLYRLADGTWWVWDKEQKRTLEQVPTVEDYDERKFKYPLEPEFYELVGQTAVTVRTTPVPEFDYICESANRLWGVRNSQENKVWNEDTKQWDRYTSRVICASALGEPGKFFLFQGLSTDSWQCAVGSDGDFTAICAFRDAVLAWKADRLVKVLGSYPAEYYSAEYQVPGVAAGSFRSLAVVSETLYYNSPHGVFSYSGSIPQPVGTGLGEALVNAAGGASGSRYYLSGTWAGGGTALLVYDALRGLWMQEDSTLADCFARVGGTLHLLTSSGAIWLLEQGEKDVSGNTETAVSWSAELAEFTETETLRKYYLRLDLRLDMGVGSSCTVQVRYDKGTWETVDTLSGPAAGTEVGLLYRRTSLPLRRCDRFSVRLSGSGTVLVRDLTRVFRGGSER